VLVAGEGGLVATRDAGLATTLRMGRDYGNPGDYNTQFAGLNARMSEFHAAMALESLERFDETLERRRKLAALYVDLLAEIPGIRTQLVSDTDLSTYKDFTIAVDPDFGLGRDDLVMSLAAEGIDTRNYFDPPVHRQQAYADYEVAELPTTDATAAKVVSLPIYPDLREDHIVRVVDAIAGAHVHAAELGSRKGRDQQTAAGRSTLRR
jgi:dTDP-4-amino-4,6-dideoxygalactose transaminase